MTDETLELGLTDAAEAPPAKPRKRAARKAKSATSAPAPTGSWVLTNRFNLIEMLSSRLIAPVQSYRQYYKDLLVETPHGIPVFADPPGPGLRDKVVTDGENNFAVLVQLGGDVPADTIVGALALHAVTAIHFPDEEKLRDHQSRPLGNVLPPPPLLASPHLFAETGADHLPASPTTPPGARDWTTIDRARGAAAGLTAAARVHDIPRGSVEGFLDGHATVVTALTSDVPVSTASADDDGQLALAAIAALTGSDPTNDWSPRRLVKALLADHGDRSDIARNLEAVRQIVAGERDFTPFRSTDGGGLVSAKALLMVLLRPRLDSLLTWPREDTNADDATLLLSGALAGWLTGVTRLPADLRDASVDDATANWACEHDRQPIPLRQLLPAPQTPTVAATPDLALLDGREVGVATRLGVPVVTRLTLDATATVAVEDGQLVVTTTGPATLSRAVDREAVVDALRELAPAEANDLLTSMPKDDD